MRFRGENPVYKGENFDRDYDNDRSATYGGVTVKTTLLLGIIAVFAMRIGFALDLGTISGSIVVFGFFFAPIIAMICVFMTHRRPQMAMFTSIIYAACEGVFLGLVSAAFSYYFGGEIIQMALLGTMSVLGVMLVLYSTGMIRVGSFFRKFMTSMIIGLVITSILLFIMSMTNVLPNVFETTYIGIVILSVIISSLYLLIDFDNISRYVSAGAPKESEWALSLGLVVTIVWLYFELLRLIAIIMDRSN